MKKVPKKNFFSPSLYLKLATNGHFLLPKDLTEEAQLKYQKLTDLFNSSQPSAGDKRNNRGRFSAMPLAKRSCHEAVSEDSDSDTSLFEDDSEDEIEEWGATVLESTDSTAPVESTSSKTSTTPKTDSAASDAE